MATNLYKGGKPAINIPGCRPQREFMRPYPQRVSDLMGSRPAFGIGDALHPKCRVAQRNALEGLTGELTINLIMVPSNHFVDRALIKVDTAMPCGSNLDVCGEQAGCPADAMNGLTFDVNFVTFNDTDDVATATPLDTVVVATGVAADADSMQNVLINEVVPDGQVGVIQLKMLQGPEKNNATYTYEDWASFCAVYISVQFPDWQVMS